MTKQKSNVKASCNCYTQENLVFLGGNTVNLKELDLWFKSILDLESSQKADPSLNGVQVGRMDASVNKVAFAVDACMESFRRAKEWGADVLFVHHGIFWGGQYPISGNAYDRLEFLCTNQLALYAAHLPLDLHAEVGNNICLARELNLENILPFGSYRGLKIGWKGTLPQPLKIEEIVGILFGDDRGTLGRLPFGPKDISSVGIVSGGAPDEVDQAIAEGLDLFITGDASHEIYHRCLEAHINVIFGGHYQTEIWGVSHMAKRLKTETGLETRFIDLPTGL